MRFVIFGTGKYFLNRKDQLFQLDEKAEIVCYIDNNAKEDTWFEGIKVRKPGQLEDLLYDKILLMSRSCLEMKAQLIALGYSEKTIWTWEQFLCEMSHGKFEFFCKETEVQKKDGRILIISIDLGYNGGSIAAAHAAMALADRYEVVLAAPRGDKKFIREMKEAGIHILLCPAFPYLGEEEVYLIKRFDLVMVNVFQMLPVVCQVNKLRPTLWWIHEPSDMYADILERFPSLPGQPPFRRVNIKAVSNVPKENFNAYFPNRIQATLAYGIPDKFAEDPEDGEKATFVFAVIGGVVPRKAQDVFIKAVGLLSSRLSPERELEYWLIGGIFENEYGNLIRKMAEGNSRIRIKGKLTREEIAKAFQEIDVVVCPSYEDPLPIVMTEGMMYGKVCIASDVTGTADYIQDKVNGLVFKTGDEAALADKMEWVIAHPDRRRQIGENARKTYQENFTMEKFSQRLYEAVNETITLYEE